MQGTLNLVLYMAFFFGLMYFLIIRPQNKKNKQLNDLRANLKAGDIAVTIGGMVGKVLNVKDDEVVLEVGASRTKLTFKKWAISSVEVMADIPTPSYAEEPVEVVDDEEDSKEK